MRFSGRMINGLPALIGEFTDGHRGEPPRMVLRCELDESGRISALHPIVASRKLSAMRFDVDAEP